MLVLSQNSQGSFALAEAFSERVTMAIQAYLTEIADVLNTDLIPQTFALNKWDDERLPQITFEDLDQISLEEFSKAIQRIKSVGLIAKTAKNVNHIADVIGLPDKVEEDISDEDLAKVLGEETSNAGEGMSTPFEGTRTSEGGQNDNDNNTENTA